MLPYNDFVSFYSLLAPSTLEDAMIIMCIANRFLFLYSPVARFSLHFVSRIF